MRVGGRFGRSAFSLCFLIAVLLVPYGYGQKARETKQPLALYAIAARLPLSQDANGIDGYIELLQDIRLNSKLVGLMWGSGGNEIDDDPNLAVFKNQPPRTALIQIVDRAGKVIDKRRLQRPLAKLRTAHLYGNTKLTYLLTVDYSAGFGSYSGPITNLMEVQSGHMQWIESTDAKTRRSGKISLMESLKTTWKLVDAKGGDSKQILFAQCRPDWSSVKEDPDFTTTYARFYFDGSNWNVVQRKVKGLSEFDQGFPSRKHFP